MPRHVRRSRASRPIGSPGYGAQVPTKPTKALVAALITAAGLVGLQLTEGTAQLIIMAAQLLLVTYGVWRARNEPKDPPTGPSVGEYL